MKNFFLDLGSMQSNMQNNIEEISTQILSKVKGVDLLTQFQLLFKRSVQCTLRDLVI